MEPERRQLFFRKSIWNWRMSLHIKPEQVFRAIGVLSISQQLRILQVKYKITHF